MFPQRGNRRLSLPPCQSAKPLKTPKCLQNACTVFSDGTMPNITIRNVDAALHVALKKKAEFSGQSLQEYLLQQLRAIATKRSNAEIIRDYRERMKELNEPGYSREEIEAGLAQTKEERDNRWKRWS